MRHLEQNSCRRVPRRRITALLAGAAIIVSSMLVQSAQADHEVIAAVGKLRGIRIHERGTAFGAPGTPNFVDHDVVVRLDSTGTVTFGFPLTSDSLLTSRLAMLDLLRDLFAADETVRLEYVRAHNGGTNHLLFRVLNEGF
jgi:hypothetical protein